MSLKSHILLDDQESGQVRVYDRPVDVVTAWTPAEVEPAFAQIQKYQKAGYYAAGFASYELGHIFEPRLAAFVPANPEIPLMRFGIYKSYHTISDNLFNPCAAVPDLKLVPAWQEEDYINRFDKVIEYLRAGDVYQINLTFPMTGQYEGSAVDLYSCLRERQPGQFGGVLSYDDFEIASLSPELFFQRDGDQIFMRPMKGTARRLPDPKADLALRESMRHDVKSQAENLMIVDLLRNDLSRIAEKASVKVPELFALETYPTLHQMTSRIKARVSQSIPIRQLFQCLFPCGSVTGAPKIRAMEIIHELEGGPRGAYCGSIGFIDPDGASCFNVAIRTFTLMGNQITYNVGSGIVLDSQGNDEYAECLLKAAVTQPDKPDLIETFRYDPNKGFIRLDRHLARLNDAARQLGYPIALHEIKSELGDLVANHPLRVRLTLSATGEFNIETEPFKELSTPIKIALSAAPLSQTVQETRYKISAREFYDRERARLQAETGCDEVLFFNPHGDLCEGSFTSVFIEKDGTLFTSDLSCGLLPGILREELLGAGRAREAIIRHDNLIDADRIFVGNSLRGLMPARLISPEARLIWRRVGDLETQALFRLIGIIFNEGGDFLNIFSINGFRGMNLNVKPAALKDKI